MNAAIRLAKKRGAPLEMFCEDGDKHKGQLEWIALYDKFPPPIARDKKLVPLQVADLIAGEIAADIELANHPSGTRHGTPCLREIAIALEQGGWRVLDPAMICYTFGVPRRDPALRYRWRILKYKGQRRPLVHYWPKERVLAPKVRKCMLNLPDPVPLTEEAFNERMRVYQERKHEMDAAVNAYIAANPRRGTK